MATENDPTFAEPAGELGDELMALRIDIAADQPGGTWIGLVGHVYAEAGTAPANEPWLQPITNDAGTLEGMLETNALINQDDVSEISLATLKVPAATCRSMIEVWLANQYHVTECAQFVDAVPSGQDGQLHWVTSAAGWLDPITTSGLADASLMFWRPARGGQISVGGTNRIAIDVASLVEGLLYTQATPSQYSTFRGSEAFRELMESGRVVIQAIATQPEPVQTPPNPATGLPATEICPIRLTFSQPVVIDLGSASKTDDPGCVAFLPRPHVDPVLVDVLGIPNPAYYAYAGYPLYIYVSRAYVDTLVRFTKVGGGFVTALAIPDLPGIVRIVVPSNVAPGTDHFDLIEPICGTLIDGSSTTSGMSVVFPPN